MINFTVKYYPSESKLFQGTEAELRKKLLDSDSYVLRGSNGSYIIGHNSYGFIIKWENGLPVEKKSPKNFIRNYYNKDRVNERDFHKLRAELEAGIVDWDDI